MVAKGLARDRSDAFEQWLNPGRPGFVVRYAPRTPDMIRIVTDAGGAAVIAHPWARSSRRVLTADDAGRSCRRRSGRRSRSTTKTTRPRTGPSCAGSPGELGLVATGSSDYHGAGKVDHDLGCNVTAPDELARLLEAAAANAAASGLAVPKVQGLDRAALVP